jgi:serine/threonine-protein kinase
MAVVLEAVRVEDGQRVAIKRLPEELSDRSSLVERFRREAAVLERLHHPRIAPLLEWGAAGDQLYFVLEWMPGGSLGERWPGSSQEQRIRWLADAAEGLAFAHAMGIVHRDVKPSNILIDADGRARLADFGLSRTWGEPSLMRPGAVLGTPPYIAPEQKAAPDDAGPPADVFALGMIARDLDFSGNAPADVAAILARATAADPVVRPSVVGVRDALLRWTGAPHALPRV